MPKPISRRHEEGLSYLASLLNWWMSRAGLSHDQLSRLAEWGGGESHLIIPSSISHLKRRNMSRGPSARQLEGLAAANRAIWLWQQKGEAAAIKELGPHTGLGIEAARLDGAIWLPTPEDDRIPLDYLDFVALAAGLLQLPYLQHQALSPSESVELSRQLGDLLNSLAGGGTPAEGIARVLAAYPLDDPDRRRRIRDLMLGEELSTEQLEEEMHALAVTVGSLRGLPEGSFRALDLHAELARDRRRA